MNSCAAPHATGLEAPRCLKKMMITCRLQIAFLMALKSSQRNMASTSFALPAAFASKRKTHPFLIF
jgi:hypothetical protein